MRFMGSGRYVGYLILRSLCSLRVPEPPHNPVSDGVPVGSREPWPQTCRSPLVDSVDSSPWTSSSASFVCSKHTDFSIRDGLMYV